MKYSENDERNSRLKRFGIAASTLAIGALTLKESGRMKNISKALGDVEKTVKGISKDLSTKAFKEYDYNTLSKVLDKNIFDENSTWNIARRTTNEIELNFKNGALPSLINLETFSRDGTYLENKMVDALQKNEVITNVSNQLKNESGDFFSELSKLVNETFNKKSLYFDSEAEGFKLIADEFKERISGTILEKHEDVIANALEDAMNNRDKLENSFSPQFRNNIQQQITDTLKEEIINKYSSSNNKDFFKETLDRAATVKDLLDNKENIKITNGKLSQFGDKENVIDFLESLVEKDDRFNDIVLDNATLRVNKNGELYSTKTFKDFTDSIQEGFADTILGKLFFSRSFLDLKKSPDLFYIPQGSYDSILANLEGSSSGLLKHDTFKLGDNFYKLVDGKLQAIKGSEDLYLMSGKHGAFNVLNNRLQGNFYSKKIDENNSFLNYLDINTTGYTIKDKFNDFYKKFDKDSDWIRRISERIFNKDNYKNISEKQARTFNKDIKALNKLYNQRTFAPTNSSINALKKIVSSGSKDILDSLDANDIAEHLIANNKSFINRDLNSILNKYKKDIANSKNLAQIGDLGGKNGLNILHYNDLLKREVVKEVLMKESLTKSTGDILTGYSVVNSKLERLKTSKAEIHNIRNLFNWSILQKETSTYAANLHSANSLEDKKNIMKNFGDLMFKKSSNGQVDLFLSEFRNNINTFTKNNSSVFDIIKQPNKDIIKAYSNNDWVAMRKSVSPMDIIKSLNDEQKFRSTVKSFGKQFIADRNHTENITTATLFPYHMINRLVTPLESMGLGFSSKNTKGTLDLAKNIMLKRVLPVIGAGYALSYLNFEAENITGTSFTQAYQNFRSNFGLGVKTIQQGLGLSDNIKRSRMYNPITNYWLGEYKDKDEYLDYLENGYDPVRKGRWWNFGSASEFRGGKISYFEPNKIRQAYSHYKDVSLYGSENEKWKHSWIPTPRHPLSPIRNLLDPYYLERKHYWDRPYPVTGKLFNPETPWGALLNPTIGEIIKPQRKMHYKELKGTLTDVRTLIANRNKEIRDKSDENRVVRVGQDGITPMQYAPASMPSSNEAVYTINTNGKGRIISSGFKGREYSDDLPLLDNDSEIIQNYNPQNTNLSIIKGTTSSNNDFASSMINGAINGLMSGNLSKSIIANLNNNIKRYSNEQSENGVIIEKTKYHTIPYTNKELNAKNKYLSSADVQAIGTKQEYISDLMYSVKELGGMYGFLADTILPTKHGYRLEDATNMNSFTRAFWDNALGGWGGDLLEIARRFFPHENHDIEKLNPIRNTMPEWLPERYLTGDPYTKVTKGEARLPGAGYESLNKLHPDQYGRYGAFDRYKILADVSPGSDEYKIWKKIAKQEITNPELIKQMDQIEKRVKEQSKEHSFYNYKFLGRDLETHKAVISKVSDAGKINIVGSNETFQLAGVKPLKDSNTKQSYIHEYLKPGMIVELMWEKNKYRNRNSEGQISALIKFDGQNISQKMWEEGKAKENENKETLADELFAASNSNMTFGPILELIAHAQIPYFHNKYLRIDSPLESYRKEQIYGNSYSTWEHPIKGFIQPTFQTAWSRGPLYQGIGIATWALSNKALKDDWEGIAKYGAHALFAFTNPGALAGGIIGALPNMNWGSHKNKIWNTKNGANIGAAVGLIGYGFANANNPLLSTFNFATAGTLIANQLKYKDIGGKEGALIGAAVGLGISAIKNPNFSLQNMTNKYIPKDTKKKWELEEYFDRLEYLKYMHLYSKAADLAKRKDHVDLKKIVNSYEYKKEQNKKEIKKLELQKSIISKLALTDEAKQKSLLAIQYAENNLQVPDQYFKMGKYTKAALAYKKAAETTIYGLTEDSSSADILRALPKYDRDYFLEFAKEKDPKERAKILKMVSPYKQKALKLMWGEKPKNLESNTEYFSKHNLPNLFWGGWNPSVNLDNVKINTIKNEGMLLSDFGIYDSQQNNPEVINAPKIKDINDAPSPLALRANILGLLNGIGLDFVDVSVEQSSTPGIQFIANIGRMTQYNLQQKINNVLHNTI